MGNNPLQYKTWAWYTYHTFVFKRFILFNILQGLHFAAKGNTGSFFLGAEPKFLFPLATRERERETN